MNAIISCASMKFMTSLTNQAIDQLAKVEVSCVFVDALIRCCRRGVSAVFHSNKALRTDLVK